MNRKPSMPPFQPIPDYLPLGDGPNRLQRVLQRVPSWAWGIVFVVVAFWAIVLLMVAADRLLGFTFGVVETWPSE